MSKRIKLLREKLKELIPRVKQQKAHRQKNSHIQKMSRKRISSSIIQLKYKKFIEPRELHKQKINLILKKKKSRNYIKTRFLVDYSHSQEFISKYHGRRKSERKLVECGIFYRYHYDIPRIFITSFLRIIDSFHDRRREHIYRIVCQKIGRDNIVGCGDEENSTMSLHKSYPDLLKSIMSKIKSDEMIKSRKSLRDFKKLKVNGNLKKLIHKNFTEFGALGLVAKGNRLKIFNDITPIMPEVQKKINPRNFKKRRNVTSRSFKIGKKSKDPTTQYERSERSMKKIGHFGSVLINSSTTRASMKNLRNSVEMIPSFKSFKARKNNIFTEPSISRTRRANDYNKPFLKSKRAFHVNLEKTKKKLFSRRNLKILNLKSERGTEKSLKIKKKRLTPLTYDNSNSPIKDSNILKNSPKDPIVQRRKRFRSKNNSIKRMKSQEFKISKLKKKLKVHASSKNLFKESLKKMFNKEEISSPSNIFTNPMKKKKHQNFKKDLRSERVTKTNQFLFKF